MSLLIVNRVETDSPGPEQVSGDLRLGGHPEQVVLDLSLAAGFIAYERMPSALEHHEPAKRAVIDLMMRRHRGEAVTLPADLSDVVRQASLPWPLRAPSVAERAALQLTAKAAVVEVVQVEHDQPDPGVHTVRLDFGGARTVVIVDPRDGPRSEVRFRFVEGAHPWQLAPPEQYALLVALLPATRKLPRG